MKLRAKYWCSGLVLVGIVVALLGPTVAFAHNANPGVFPINSRPYGQTYGQWSARWWQSTFQQTTLNICTRDKPGSRVTFLISGFGGSAIQSCTVPAGHAIMFPIFVVEWSIVEAQAQQQTTPGQSCLLPGQPYGTSDAALQACVTAQTDHATAPGATLTAEVDGKALTNLTHYRAVSPPFDFTIVAGNPFGLPAGPTRAVADGFWIILTPLSPGTHTIHFTATVPFPEINFTFNTDDTYHLTVQPGK